MPAALTIAQLRQALDLYERELAGGRKPEGEAGRGQSAVQAAAKALLELVAVKTRSTAVCSACAAPGALAAELLARRAALMMKLCASDPKQAAFALGWARRIVGEARKLGA